MFTSRAEYRILLRQDNADLRLTEIGYNIGLASHERLDNVVAKKLEIKSLMSALKKLKLDPDVINNGLANLNTTEIKEKLAVSQLLKRPQVGIEELKSLSRELQDLMSNYSLEVQQQAEINIKYESYIEREQMLVEKMGNLEHFKIFPDFDYDRIKALSSEAREKLKKMRPETVGQASRISGVSPADVSVLTIYMGK
jgi:tRNA uridine 5-carboxymethylaminomethyl modification enzyme